MNNRRHTSAGFTMIELLVYIALVSGILIAATTFGWNVVNSRTKAFAIQEVEYNGRFIMSMIERTVRQGEKVAYPDANQIADRLSIVEPGQPDTSDIALEKDELIFTDGSHTRTTLNTSQVAVTDFQVTTMSDPDGTSPGIKIVCTLSHRNPEHRQEWSATDTFETFITLHNAP